MCILCVIQKWSRRVATMLPWLVIPLIGLWLLSQLLPPAFRFEITSPRLACVFVLLVTLFWYEILMPQLSSWRLRRNARLRERKRFEAIELQKLRKTATRRCRNCLTPYRDQNPGGGKFMCSYCGHVSKRPVLDLPVTHGLSLSNSGLLKDLVGKGGKILNGKAWSDSGWLCGQDWLENGNWVVARRSSYRRNGGGVFGGEDDCLAEKSYSRVFAFACKLFTTVFLSLLWLLRKLFRISSSGDDASMDVDRGGPLDRSENGGTYHESRGEKARRKAEEKRQARLEKELLEEEERKQREEVARLVEERRRLRDEKMEAEKEHGKRSSPSKGRGSKKEAEMKRHERKKERDRGSSKSNSDVEELEKRVSKESERYKKCDIDRRENHRTVSESVKTHGNDVGHAFKGTPTHNHSRGIAGNRYFDRVRGTFLSSSRAFTGGGFFGKSSNITVTREPKHSAFVDQVQAHANKRELSQIDRASAKPSVHGDEKNIRPVLFEPQPGPAPKKSWQQLFTRSSAAPPPPSNANVISRPNGSSKQEVSNPFPCSSPPAQAFDNPISFGLPSPFALPSFPFGSANGSTGFLSSSEAMFPQIGGEALVQFLPEESEIFEDPCYVPDPVSLLGPVSESLDNFQLDLGFVSDTGLETPSTVKSTPLSAEVSRPSPIESPISRLRISEERHTSPFSFPGSSRPQELRHLPVDGQTSANDTGTWQMWNSSPLVQEGLGLVGGSASWLLPAELNRPKNEDILHHVPQRTMASLFKNDDPVLAGTSSPGNVLFGCVPSGGTHNSSMTVGSDGSWLPTTFFRPNSGSEDHFSSKLKEEAAQNSMIYGNPSGYVPTHLAEVSATNSWGTNDKNMQGSGVSVGNASMMKPHVGGLYSTPDVQSLWSYD